MSSGRDVSAAILAGGVSSRMGRCKALLPFRGRPLVSHVHDAVRSIFGNVFLVTNEPGRFGFLPCAHVPDRVPGKGPISGVDAALRNSRFPHVLVVGCDAPFLSPALLDLLAGRAAGADLVIPSGPRGPEPLCAVYGKEMLSLIEESLSRGDRSLIALVGRLRTREISPEEVAAVDPGYRSFRNINTPEEYRQLIREG